MLSHIPTDGLKVGELKEVCCAQPFLNFIGSGRKQQQEETIYDLYHVLFWMLYIYHL
jgi:hypothetical protein